jgi:glycopeptide antibiotics resistance protein
MQIKVFFIFEGDILFNYSKLNKAVNISIVLFVIFLVWGIYLKFGNIEQVKLNYSNLSNMTIKERFMYDIIPFKFTYPIKNQKIEVILNGLIFMPLGLFLCIKDNKVKFLKHLFICFIVSLTFEVVQLFTMIGGFATDDIIMNTSGYILGMFIYLLFIKKLNDKYKYYFLFISNIIMGIIILYGIVNIIDVLPEYIELFGKLI